MSEGELAVRGPTLALRYATLADAPGLFELARDADVTRFFSWGPYERVGQAADYIASLAGRRERGELLDFVVVHPEQGVLGVTGLGELSRRDRRAVVGSWLGRPWWGSGANDEAKALLTRLAFQTLGLERLSAYASPANPRSVRALEKVGFTQEGLLRDWHRHGDAVHDVLFFRLLREEWEGSPLAAVPGTASGTPPAAFDLG